MIPTTLKYSGIESCRSGTTVKALMVCFLYFFFCSIVLCAGSNIDFLLCSVTLFYLTHRQLGYDFLILDAVQWKLVER